MPIKLAEIEMKWVSAEAIESILKYPYGLQNRYKFKVKIMKPKYHVAINKSMAN